MPKTQSRYTCKGVCVQLEGYQEGYFHFSVEGKRYCSECGYKIPTNNKYCSCCGSPYRINNRKKYHNDGLLSLQQ